MLLLTVMLEKSKVKIVALVLIAIIILCKDRASAAPTSAADKKFEGSLEVISVTSENNYGDNEFTHCSNCSEVLHEINNCTYPHKRDRKRDSFSCSMSANTMKGESYCCKSDSANAIYCKTSVSPETDALILTCWCHFDANYFSKLHSCYLYMNHE